MSSVNVLLLAYSADYSLIREAQMAALKLDNVGYALAIDIGDPTSPEGNIHPRRKQEVGRRLSLSCLAMQYNQPLEYLGPQLVHYELSGTGTGVMCSLGSPPPHPSDRQPPSSTSPTLTIFTLLVQLPARRAVASPPFKQVAALLIESNLTFCTDGI